MVLPAANPALPAKPPGEATVCIVDRDIVSICFSGHIDERVAHHVLVRVREVITARRVRVLLCDTLGVTAVEMSVREPLCAGLALLKEHGVRNSFCALSSAAVRMLSVALGLATGVRVHFFSTIGEARAAAQAPARR